jgi:hypothetical protein
VLPGAIRHAANATKAIDVGTRARFMGSLATE